MARQTRYGFALVSPIFLLAACGSSQRHTARLLDHRLEARLAGDIASGDAVLQRLPDGAQVTLLGTSLFPNDIATMANKNPDVRTDLVEGLLAPSLMRIKITDTGALTDEQRNARVQNMNQYFVANGLASTLDGSSPAEPMPPGPATGSPAGLRITISVDCSHRNDDRLPHPICD